MPCSKQAILHVPPCSGGQPVWLAAMRPYAVFECPVTWSIQRELAKDQLEFYNRCFERWFATDLQDDDCGRCQKIDATKAPEEPFTYSTASELNSGYVGDNLHAVEIFKEGAARPSRSSCNKFQCDADSYSCALSSFRLCSLCYMTSFFVSR